MPNKNHGEARTTSTAASKAAKVLKDPKSTKVERSVAASALRQRRGK